MASAAYVEILSALYKQELFEIAGHLSIEAATPRTLKADLVRIIGEVDPHQVFGEMSLKLMRHLLGRMGESKTGSKAVLCARLIELAGPVAADSLETAPKLAQALVAGLDTSLLLEIALDRLGDRDVRRTWSAVRIATEITQYQLASLRAKLRIDEIRYCLRAVDLDTRGDKYTIFDRLLTSAGIEPLQTAGAPQGPTQEVQLPPVADAATETERGPRVKVLLIGNAAYDKENALANPVKDVNDLGEMFARLGHDVVVRHNLTKKEMTKALGEFGRSVSPIDGAVFYFSGHGVEQADNTWLLPVEFDGTCVADLEDSIRVARVLKNIAHGRFRVVILDSCRSVAYRGLTRGIAEEPVRSIDLPPEEGTEGSLICYATSPGKTALDGVQGTNGEYTGALLKHMAVKGRTIEQAMKAVRQEVAAKTKGKQVPWEHSSFIGDWYPAGR